MLSRLVKRKMCLALAGILALTYLGLCLSLRLWQTRLIFFPSEAIAATPASFALPYEEVSIGVGKQQIQGWWIPAAAGQEKKVILYLHGNSSNIGDELDRAWLLHQLGVCVLLIDYRGYGKSRGSFPREASVYEDGEAAWNYLQQTREVTPENIFLYGRSLGGAIAIELASRHPEAAGVIVEGTFTSIKAMIDYLIWEQLLPVDWILTERFDSLAKVRSLSTPILFIHGTADQTIPVQMSQELFAATPAPKQLLLIPHAEHDNTARLGGKRYLQSIQQFLQGTGRESGFLEPHRNPFSERRLLPY